MSAIERVLEEPCHCDMCSYWADPGGCRYRDAFAEMKALRELAAQYEESAARAAQELRSKDEALLQQANMLLARDQADAALRDAWLTYVLGGRFRNDGLHALEVAVSTWQEASAKGGGR